MNVFHKYSRKTLQKNKVRTLVTIIGVILSISLFTAVLEGAYSGINYLIEQEIAVSGRHHGLMHHVDQQKSDDIRNDPKIREYFFTRDTAVALSESDDSFFTIESIEENPGTLVPFVLIEGKMPENANEIIVAADFFPDINVGEKLHVKTVSGNGEIPVKMKKLKGTEYTYKTYTVTGKISAPYIVDYFIKAYTTGENTGSINCMFSLENPKSYYSYVASQKHTDAKNIIEHDSLLRLYGCVRSDGLYHTIKNLASILVGIVFFGSVMLIYNAFAISVSERTRQFGILKSIGATGKQLRSAVLYEVLLISLIAIPTGIIIGVFGIGITLWALKDHFTILGGILYNPVTNAYIGMRIAISPYILLIAAVLGFITIFAAAMIPAYRVSKISPMNAIRQNKDIVVKNRKRRGIKIGEKLFGFEGMMASRYFNRSKKGSRVVLLSLFASVVLFIGSDSFCSYLSEAVTSRVKWTPDFPDISAYINLDEDTDSPDEIIKKLRTVDGVKECLYYTEKHWNVTFYESRYECIRVLFIDDDSFKKICSKNKIDPSGYFESEHPCAIMYNNSVSYSQDGGRKKEEFIDGITLPLTVYATDPYDEEQKKEIIIKGILTDAVSDIEREFIAYPYSMRDTVITKSEKTNTIYADFKVTDHEKVFSEMNEKISSSGNDKVQLFDNTGAFESEKRMIVVLRVFSVGFLILMFLISVANIINIVNTNITLRKRDFSTLCSVGLSGRSYNRMMGLECIYYGAKSLMWSLPSSVLLSYFFYENMELEISDGFYIPLRSIIISVISVFFVIFITMMFATRKIKKENIIDIMKNENI